MFFYCILNVKIYFIDKIAFKQIFKVKKYGDINFITHGLK